MATSGITFMGGIVTFNTRTIGEVISAPSGDRNCTWNDILTADSTDNAVEAIAGAINEGVKSIRIVYDGSTTGVYHYLNTDYLARTKATLLITMPDTSSFSMTAGIETLGMPEAGAADNTLEVNLGFKVSGKITFADVP